MDEIGKWIASLGLGWSLLLFFTYFFLHKYIEQKAIQLATKEDLKEVTRTVESIKAQIDFSSKYKSHHKNREYEHLQQILLDLMAIEHSLVSLTHAADSASFGIARQNLDDMRQQLIKNIEIARLFLEQDSPMLKHAEDAIKAVECLYLDVIDGETLSKFVNALNALAYYRHELLAQDKVPDENRLPTYLLINMTQNQQKELRKFRKDIIQEVDSFRDIMLKSRRDYISLLREYYTCQYTDED